MTNKATTGNNRTMHVLSVRGKFVAFEAELFFRQHKPVERSRVMTGIALTRSIRPVLRMLCPHRGQRLLRSLLNNFLFFRYAVEEELQRGLTASCHNEQE